MRRALVVRYHLTAERFRPRDEWLTGQLLALVEALLTKVEAGESLTPAASVRIADVRTVAAEAQRRLRGSTPCRGCCG